MARNTIRFEAFWPGNVIGLPDINSCSFANATRLPVSVTAPMIRLSCMTTPVGVGMSVPASNARRNSAAPTIIDAPPPKPLSSATICGIAVIFTA